MFDVGDTVLYGNQGVCRITARDEKKIAGTVITYYVLKPVCDENSTVYVPSSNTELLSKMRAVLSEKEIYELIEELPDKETIWIDDENERKQKYQAIIDEGDRKKLVQLIKTLRITKEEKQKSKKKFHQSDEMILKQAEKLLYSEFALVLNIAPDEVLPFMMQQLHISQKGA